MFASLPQSCHKASCQLSSTSRISGQRMNVSRRLLEQSINGRACCEWQEEHTCRFAAPAKRAACSFSGLSLGPQRRASFTTTAGGA
eukprot:scaffold68569_cov22-Tisochrysis_lutea.AAC.1